MASGQPSYLATFHNNLLSPVPYAATLALSTHARSSTTHTHAHTCTLACKHPRTARTHAHIHAHTHTHIHTHTCILGCKVQRRRAHAAHAVVVAEDGVAGTHKDGGGHLGPPVVVKQVGGDLRSAHKHSSTAMVQRHSHDCMGAARTCGCAHGHMCPW